MRIRSILPALPRCLPTVLLVAAVAPSSGVADWTVDDGVLSTAGVAQDIVISLKLNPRSNAEATCLAVTLARSLRGDFSPPEAPPTHANVTLFPTLDGVAIGDEHVVTSPRFQCTTPEGVITLEENLQDFLCDTGDRDDCFIPDDLNMNNLVICPICWIERYGEGIMPDYGVLNPQAVGAVILNAEKVFDF
jgi:hypothetical protein